MQFRSSIILSIMSALPYSLFSLLGSDLIRAAAAHTGESEAQVQNLLKASVSTLMCRVMYAPQSEYDLLANLLVRAGSNKSYGEDVMHALHSQSMHSPALSLGNSLLEALYDDRYEAFLREASTFAGTKAMATKTLMALSGTIVAFFLGSKIAGDGLSTQGLINWLQAEEQIVKNLVPAAFAGYSQPSAKQEHNPDHDAPMAYPNTAEETETSEGLQWILPLLLTGLIAFGIWYWVMGSRHEAAVSGNNHPKTEQAKESAMPAEGL